MIRTGRLQVITRRPHLLLPIAALVIVGAMQAWNLSRPAPAAPKPVDVSLPAVTDVGPTVDGATLGGVDTSDTDGRIAFWQARLKNQGDSSTSYQILGDLLAQKGRETGDLSNYASAEAAYRRALVLAPKDVSSLAGLARILSTLHQFPEAITQAQAVLALDQRATSAVAVIFDASLEIGNLGDADEALAALEKAAPGPAVTVRQARLAFLRGDTTMAATLAQGARDEAGSEGAVGEEIAFYDYALGEYRFMAGDLGAAGKAYDAAATALPGYPLALFGQARVAYAHGDSATAIARLQQAVAIVPRPDLLAYLGDLQALGGDHAKAGEQYQTIDFIAGLGTAPGQVYNREYALFLAGHARDTAKGVQLATSELAQRKDVYGYDAQAWALFANGQPADALTPMHQALALGTQDARLLYHAGMIEIANGQTDAGRNHLQQALSLGLAYDPLGQARAKAALTP